MGSFVLVVYHMGHFVKEPSLHYDALEIHSFKNLDPDKWSFYGLRNLVRDEFKYKQRFRMWWKHPEQEDFQKGLILIDDDTISEVMLSVAYRTGAELEVYIEHEVKDAVPVLEIGYVDGWNSEYVEEVNIQEENVGEVHVQEQEQEENVVEQATNNVEGEAADNVEGEDSDANKAHVASQVPVAAIMTKLVMDHLKQKEKQTTSGSNGESQAATKQQHAVNDGVDEIPTQASATGN